MTAKLSESQSLRGRAIDASRRWLRARSIHSGPRDSGVGGSWPPAGPRTIAKQLSYGAMTNEADTCGVGAPTNPTGWLGELRVSASFVSGGAGWEGALPGGSQLESTRGLDRQAQARLDVAAREEGGDGR